MRTVENPDSAGLPFVRIVRPQLKNSLLIHPLVDTVKPYRMHRIKGRSIPCMADPCLFCSAKEPLDNRIFIFGEDRERSELVFVDVPAAHHFYLASVAEQEGTLKNTELKFVRLDGRENGSIGIRKIPITFIELRSYPQEWIERVLERNFLSNTQKALLDLASAGIRSSTMAQNERSGCDATPDEERYFRDLLELRPPTNNN